ncbi:MAG: polysaccharide biosynthesis protein [Candidatus Dormibacteraeota bacterium]|nr:polysaccharide biosynthesis protein [Candidatus Dormibacteraeota bacterium]
MRRQAALRGGKRGQGTEPGGAVTTRTRESRASASLGAEPRASQHIYGKAVMIQLEEREVRGQPLTSTRSLRALLVGAGQAGRMMANAFRWAPEYGLDPIAFVDDDGALPEVGSIPVLGRIADLPAIARATDADVVVITIPSLPTHRMTEIARLAQSTGLLVRYLPSFVAALERDLLISDLRSLSVNSLLGRDEVRVMRLTTQSVVSGRRVLVTGAGGSIGSELCRQIDAFEPSALYMLDHDESNLHRLQLQLRGHGLLDSDDIIIADIRDRNRIDQLFEQLRPEIVFHAAAHKHLPLLERWPCEGVKSNVGGTENVLRAAAESGADRFILISTDKAADPTSVLGATKRLAEMLCASYASSGLRVASVRFGNVLGSRGSLVHVIRSQIEQGEEVTITHPEVTRFFMTVEEAVGLVLEAAAMASEGEVFVLDMGDPVRILDLVHNFAAQLHLAPDAVSVRFTGLRPGEKLDEVLVGANEERAATSHPKVWNTRSRNGTMEFDTDKLVELYGASAANNPAKSRELLGEIVRGYRPARSPQPVGLASPYPDDW